MNGFTESRGKFVADGWRFPDLFRSLWTPLDRIRRSWCRNVKWTPLAASLKFSHLVTSICAARKNQRFTPLTAMR